MIVWALFDSETATVAKALPEHEVHLFGIGGGTGHIHLDLSCFKTAKEVLERYPKPDVIFASPPCESWVSLSVGIIRHFSNEKGINLHWKSKWVPFDFKPKYKQTRENGCRTAETTAKIIKHFKPQHWAIENGNSSLIFDYMYKFHSFSGFLNKCNYYSYGFNVLKPTIIYSNKLLILKNFKPNNRLEKTIEGMPSWKTIARRKNKTPVKECERSRVPPLLYRDIMSQFEHAGQKTLFPLEESA